MVGGSVTGAAVTLFALSPTAFLWPTLLKTAFVIVALYSFGMGCFMIYGSKITKVREADRLLDAVVWRGDEHVLDVGCGRGLMLVKAAKRLTSGKAIGVDIWQAEDQSENSPAAALDNARIERIEHRVTVETADMRELPFADSSFDVVLSNWVVHNLPEEIDRHSALSEMARVLRSDGTLILSDIDHRQRYCVLLADLGLTDQNIIVSALKDRILAVITFGSFRPFAIIAKQAD